jgi:subtilisin-like proprotein convertase family protein
MAAFAAFAPAAGAEVLTATQNTDIVIPTTPANVKGTPYPSTIGVQGADGAITDVNVNLNITHSFPDDLDILLVSPSGDSEILMSDACGTADLVGTSITLDNAAGSALSDSGPCSNGTFQPTNIGTGDVWPAPAPASPETTQLGNFNNETPNGVWSLYVLDDADEDGGTINSWSLTITTNTAEVIIPATGTSGAAKPYPSEKTFSTPAGKVISDLNLSFTNFTHTFPDDVDALLAGPRRGANVLAMSDACGFAPIPGPSIDSAGFFWNFDDEAPAPMSDNTVTGCFPFNVKPSNFETEIDTFPAPAPGGPYGSTMSVFDGLEGGAFRLFVNDDAGSDTGYIGSWNISLTTRDAADTGFAVSSTRVEEGGKAVLTVNRSNVAASILGPATINVSTGGSASAGSDYTAPAGTLEFARGQASATIEVPIVNDQAGEPTERFNVVLSSPQDDARLTGTTSSEVVIGPDNEIKFGKLKRNKKKGTARLFVTLPGPGKLTTQSKGVKPISKDFGQGGQVALLLKPKGKALNKLNDNGSVKVSLKVTFTPVDGSALTSTKKVKLILND